MADLRVRFGLILALALFPILLFSFYMAYAQGQFSMVALCLLAWLFAYGAIWIATDNMVFIHLRRIKTASDIFSTGAMDTRIGTLRNAPDRIMELGYAFDNMAENISEREVRLLDNLNEKETLLREIHHRVKNNLQIIISLLNMQERKLADSEGIKAIQETRSRINAIALVHRGLYEGNDLRVIEMKPFLTRLLEELSVSFGIAEQGVDIALDIENMEFEPDTAIPIALFLVETLTNAVKHGVTKDGKVIIRLAHNASDGRRTIAVTDNGSGPDETAPVVKGTGSKLIKGFARQLSGSLTQELTEDGYTVALSF